MKRFSLLFLISSFLFLMSASSALATTYYVSPAGSDSYVGTNSNQPKLTINSAESVAVSGDEIHVKQGIYSLTAPGTGTITLKDGVYLRGGYDDNWDPTGGPSTTIISGEGSVRCMYGIWLGTTTTIENFTIKKGYASEGGGICNYHGSPTITNCIFINNSSTIGWGGGAIFNAASQTTSSPTIKNCAFISNTGSGGSAIYNYGGQYMNGFASPTISNCTFTSNEAYEGTILNRGLIGNNFASPIITNSIIYGNSGGSIINWENAFPAVTYSCIQGGTVYSGQGNINDDPLFVNAPASNVRLYNNSPCVNAGTGEASTLGLGWDKGYGTGPDGVYGDTGTVNMGYHYTGYTNSGPSNFLGTAESASSIRWSWSNVSDEAGYYLYDNADILRGATTVDVTNTLEAGLSANTQYTRHVHAYNAYCTTEASNSYSRYTLADNPVMGVLTAASTSITVNWSSGGAQGHYHLGYSGNNYAPLIYDGSSTSYQKTGLSVNTQYTFRVWAANGENVDSASSAEGTKYTLANAPGTPVIGVTTSSEVITWTANGNPGTTTYEVAHSTDGATWESIPVYTGTATTCTNSSLGGNTKHYYKVRAENGDGVYTNYVKTSPTFEYTYANKPSIPLVTGEYDADPNIGYYVYITIVPNGNPDSTEYAIYTLNGFPGAGWLDGTGVSVANPTWMTKADWETDGVNTNTNLAAGTSYSYRVKARNGDNVETSLSNTGTGTTPSGPTPSVPIGLTTTQVGTYSAYSTWETVPTATSYTISYGIDTNASNIGITTEVVPHHSWTSLSPATPYYWKVSAVNTYGGSGYGSIASFETLSGPKIWYVDVASPEGNSGTINSPFKTINSAEAAANSGDEIHVKQGIYSLTAPGTGTITLKDGVYLRGGYDSSWNQTGGPSTTIVSGEGSVRCMYGSGLSSTTTIENFTIKKGGGGLYLTNSSSPTITNCTFTLNSASTGGGIYNNSCSPTITNCTFTLNSSTQGGGIYNYGGSYPTITNCTFTSNSGSTAGGIWNSSSSPTITNCTFTSNSAIYAGGIYNGNGSYPTITNCTFTSNSASGSGGNAGGIYNDFSSPTITNSIIYYQTSGGSIYNTNISSSPSVNYSCIQGGYPTGTGNISTNPLFVNPPGDVHLQISSPCINAGSGEASALGLGGGQGYGTNPNGVNGDSGVVDMGYHYSGYTLANTPSAPTGLTTTGITTNSAYSTWSVVPTATSYTISYGTDIAATNEGIIATAEASYGWTGFAPATKYYWKVSATNTNGTGEYSSIASFETLSLSLPPSAPTGLTTTGITTNSAQSTWNVPAGSPTYYTISYGTNAAATNEGTTTEAAAAHSWAGLTTATKYYWKVSATSANGTGEYSSTASFETLSSLPPSAPTGLTTTGITTNSAYSTWGVPAGSPTFYTISYGTNAAATNEGTTTETPAAHSWTGLTPVTNYYWKVSATSANGTGEYSSTASFETLSLPPAAPPLVTVEAPNGGQPLTGGVTYEIRWSATAESGIKSNGITLRYSTDSGSSWTLINSGLPNTRIYSWEAAKVNSTYCRVSVEAEDVNGKVGTDMSDSDFTISTEGVVMAPTIEAVRVNGISFRSGDVISSNGTLEAVISSEAGVNPTLTLLKVDYVPITPPLYLVSGNTNYGTWRGTYTITPGSQQVHIFAFHLVDMAANASDITMEAIVMGGGVQVIGTPNNYPNPFSPMSGGTTNIQYTLSRDATITIIIYDISGHEVKRMKYSSGTSGARGGTNQVGWNGKSLGGEVIGNGMYFYKIISGNQVIGSGKLVIQD